MHGQNTNWSCGQAPTCLPSKPFHFLLIFKLNSEHFGKVLAKVMACGCLNSSSVFRNPSFHSCGFESSCELFWFSFNSFVNGNCQYFLINSPVVLQNCEGFFFSFFECCMGCVSFLPQELTCSNKGSGMLKLPPHNVRPLVQTKGKVSMTLDPIGICRIHDGLTGGSNCNGLSKIALSWFSNPGNFGSEAFNVFFLSFEGFLGNKHWEISVFNSMLFNQSIEKLLYSFPNTVAPGPEDVAAWDIIIIKHAWFVDNICIPVGKIFLFLVLNSKKIDFFFGFLFLFFLLLFLLDLHLLGQINLFVSNLAMVQEF